MTLIEDIKVNISAVIGGTRMPIRQLLKMGRGAVIALDACQASPVEIFANDELIARGEIIVVGEAVRVRVTERATR